MKRENDLSLITLLAAWLGLITVAGALALLLAGCGGAGLPGLTAGGSADPAPPITTPTPEPTPATIGCQIDAPDNSGTISCSPTDGCVIVAANNSGSISCGGDGLNATMTLTAANESAYRLEFAPPVVSAECSTTCTDRDTLEQTATSETITLSGTVSDICVNNATPHIVTCAGQDDTGAVVITDSITLSS